jgi:hypothetical protein
VVKRSSGATKNGEPALQVPQLHDAAQESSCLPSYTNLNLRASCGARFFDRNARGRMMSSPRLRVRRARADMNDVRDRIPFAIKLADLFLIYIKRERDLMISLSRFGVHRGYIEPALRSGIQNAHQRALCIAVANVKLHM